MRTAVEKFMVSAYLGHGLEFNVYSMRPSAAV
jgi:hypothetical protein